MGTVTATAPMIMLGGAPGAVARDGGPIIEPTTDVGTDKALAPARAAGCRLDHDGRHDRIRIRDEAKLREQQRVMLAPLPRRIARARAATLNIDVIATSGIAGAGGHVLTGAGINEDLDTLPLALIGETVKILRALGADAAGNCGGHNSWFLPTTETDCHRGERA